VSHTSVTSQAKPNSQAKCLHRMSCCQQMRQKCSLQALTSAMRSCRVRAQCSAASAPPWPSNTPKKWSASIAGGEPVGAACAVKLQRTHRWYGICMMLKVWESGNLL
jgi:hypothetical protein